MKNNEEKLPEAIGTGEEKPRRVEWNRKYTTIAVYALLVILFAVVCVFFFLNYNDFGKYISKIIAVFNPIFYGIIIAYLLNYAVKLFERSVFHFLDKPGKLRTRRLLSVFLTAICVLMVFSLVMVILIPQVIAGYKDLEGKMGFYIESVQKWLTDVSGKEGIFSSFITSAVEYINSFIGRAYELLQNIVPLITSAAKTIVVTVKDLLLGFIFAIYFLIAKERLCVQLKKLVRAISGNRFYDGTMRVCSLVNDKFGSFLIGRIIDSILISVLCFIGTWAIGIPYYPLVSLIIGLTNIVPLFGPIVGIVVTGFIVFISSMNPWMLFWYLLFVILLQIVNANFINGKMPGGNAGLSATWIFIAIIIMTGFFGIAGTIIGVPLFAVLYDVGKRWTEKKLAAKNAPINTKDYYADEDALLIDREYDESKEKKRLREEKLRGKTAAFRAKLLAKKESSKQLPENAESGEKEPDNDNK